jgi:hypothetical protein
LFSVILFIFNEVSRGSKSEARFKASLVEVQIMKELAIWENALLDIPVLSVYGRLRQLSLTPIPGEVIIFALYLEQGCFLNRKSIFENAFLACHWSSLLLLQDGC